ncbi:hypothetical protein ACIHEI_35795 [Kitasatospora sp. NPDC051984]|uniref:hypothetical protein n=1 Tax=Kitasatospora sp. NPDC051984 TaxID=3364059 RepID=UPI0037C92995
MDRIATENRELTSGQVLAPGLDPVLADRVTEALLLAGLPVAHGGHGPGVHLVPNGGAIALRWLASPRLEDAATVGGGQNPAATARQLVADALENALAELLPAFDLDAERTDAPARTTVRGSAARPDTGPTPPPSAPAAPPPVHPGVRAEIVTAVRRSATLAGLPVATRPGGAGITLNDCDAAGLADLGWNPSPRLAAPDLTTAVQDAMRHALGIALRATGLDLSWHRPSGRPAQLRAHGPA